MVIDYGLWKTIELFLVNGTADSIITAELSNWNGKAIKIPLGLWSPKIGKMDAHHGHPFFLRSKVLNDTLFVLLLLRTKFPGGVPYEGRTEETDHCFAPRWGGVWRHSQPIGSFHQHREIVLPAAQSG